MIRAYFLRLALCCAASSRSRVARGRWLIALLLCLPMALRAQGAADDIVGDWLVASRDAVVRIAERNGVYDGTLVWLLHDKYGIEDGAARYGHPVLDEHNPDPALRNRPLLGLTILTNLKYDGAGNWDHGHVYSFRGRPYLRRQGEPGGSRHAEVARLYRHLRCSVDPPRWTRIHQLPPAAD